MTHTPDRPHRSDSSLTTDPALPPDDDTLGEHIEAVGERLLAQHPLLLALCTPGSGSPAPLALRRIELSPPVRSLLRLYAAQHAGLLDHAVGVAMLAQSLARRLFVGDVDCQRELALAGLLHDVGELQIDPEHLQHDDALKPGQWAQIVTHPTLGHRALQDLEGAGPRIAQLVLTHHERLDGNGYPQGVYGPAFSPEGQILAMAEWLMALIERDPTPLLRARMADRLVPGEFSAELLQAVSQAARAAPQEGIDLAAVPPLAEALPTLRRLTQAMARFEAMKGALDSLISKAPSKLRTVLQGGKDRLSRIQVSLNRAGLNGPDPAPLLSDMASLNDPGVYAEVMTLLGELDWRLNEFAREQRLRAELLIPTERAGVDALTNKILGLPTPLAQAGATRPAGKG